MILLTYSNQLLRINNMSSQGSDSDEGKGNSDKSDRSATPSPNAVQNLRKIWAKEPNPKNTREYLEESAEPHDIPQAAPPRVRKTWAESKKEMPIVTLANLPDDEVAVNSVTAESRKKWGPSDDAGLKEFSKKTETTKRDLSTPTKASQAKTHAKHTPEKDPKAINKPWKSAITSERNEKDRQVSLFKDGRKT